MCVYCKEWTALFESTVKGLEVEGNKRIERTTNMIVGTIKITLHIPWVHSLKEKRMIVKSLCAKMHNKFNVSAAEVENQDMHQSAVLGIACVAGNAAHADSILDHVLGFVEGNTEGEIVEVERELL